MSSATRRPLGDTLVGNKPTVHRTMSSSNHGDQEIKLKRALADALEQRQKRAEAEGHAQGWKRDLELTKEDNEKLRKELDRAKAKIARRDETIDNLLQVQKQSPTVQNTGQQPSTSELEKKLEELVVKHRSSKVKYQAELGELKREQEALKKSNEELKSMNEGDCKNRSKLRQENAMREEEIATIRQELRAAKQAQARAELQLSHESKASSSRATLRELEDERIDRGAERNNLESEIKRLQSCLVNINALEEENVRLDTLLEASAMSYALLHRNTVSKKDFKAMDGKYQLASMERDIWRSRAQQFNRQLKWKHQELKDLRARLQTSEQEREMLQVMVEDMRMDQTILRDELASLHGLPRNEEDIELPMIDSTPLVDIALTHAGTAESYFRSEISSLEDEKALILAKLHKTKEGLKSTETSLANLHHSHAELQAVYSALQTEHSPCAAIVEELRVDLSRAEEKEGDTARALQMTSEELESAERKNREAREALKRANEVVVRAKAAEDALDEEVQHLRQALTEAEPYEGLYLDLLDKQTILESRESAAIDEAEKLGQQNAELLGHTNGDQRISYVEGVRREMAAVRQELCTTRHLLNMANDQIVKLSSEIEAYKSIDSFSAINGAGVGGSTRIRVVRRQPEGGRLTFSTSTSATATATATTAKGRSVSHPAGR